ncbi:hypothetical protein Z043_108446 [Scleropages formosus]|uniref:Calponin-homology (CH) domain-containing protein n=1 Tax=Scleropages formosus TaxID=113540 RepID=A0A0P7VBP8_SCLFO|nr:hypothetical protein Z043_108446 [Scleropages formosus]
MYFSKQFKVHLNGSDLNMHGAAGGIVVRAAASGLGIPQIYTDWANHYLAKSGCPRLIKDLTQDIADGVLLAEIIQIIANEKVEDINGCPRSQSQMIENVDACLSFLQARGVNIQGLSAEGDAVGCVVAVGTSGIVLEQSPPGCVRCPIKPCVIGRNKAANLALCPLSPALPQSGHEVRSSSGPRCSRNRAEEEHERVFMCSRLPGPSRASAAGSGTTSKVQGASNLNRRSQSFNSIDKSKPLQYASGSDRGGHVLAAVGKTRGVGGLRCQCQTRASKTHVWSLYVSSEETT